MSLGSCCFNVGTTHCDCPDKTDWTPLKVRTLIDGCEGCDRSVVYCAAVRDIERRPCCTDCLHREP